MANPTGYSRIQIALHWIIALLILFQFLFHDSMQEAWHAIEKGEAEPGGLHPHAVVGVIVLILMIVRLVIRRRHGAPELPAGGNPLQDLAAVWTHRLLYVLLFLIPLSGMIAWNFGATAAASAHGTMFFVALVLIGLHVVAAIYHQYVLKDGLIRRMMKAE
jgi:cytochrome b561